MSKEKEFKLSEKKGKVWRLIYPNKEESLMNYNPIKEERKLVVKEALKLIKAWNGYGDSRFPEGEVKELVREIKKLRKRENE